MAAGIWRNNARSWSRLVRGWDSAPRHQGQAAASGSRDPTGLHRGAFGGRTRRSLNRSLKTVTADDEIRLRIPTLRTRP